MRAHRVRTRFFIYFGFGMWISGLMGCSPVYETHYYYSPPATEMGQMCLGHCVQTRMMCDQNCDMAEFNSRRIHSYNSQREYYRPYHSFWRECSDGCHTGYNVCYQSCGGQIEYETHCVRNCGQEL